jgi:hypothetical protein
MYDLKPFQQELENIFSFWINYTPDEQNGGFYGKIDHNNQVYAEAPKGSVFFKTQILFIWRWRSGVIITLMLFLSIKNLAAFIGP